MTTSDIGQRISELSEIVPKLYRRTGNWSLVAKLLVSGLISALGGAGLLSFLIEYATYTYSVAYGFRPPVEGIPYLTSAVTAASFFLLISGAMIVASLIVALKEMPRLIIKDSGHYVQKWIDAYKRMPRRKATRYHIVVVLVSVLFGLVIAPLIARLSPIGLATGHDGLNFGFAAGMGAAMSVLMFAVRRPRAVWEISAAYVGLYYLAIVALIFSPPAYAAFLRLTGFGGGVAVVLQLDSEGSKDPVEREAFLMLRTATSLIVFVPVSRRFDEYPVERVHRLSYMTGGLGTLSYKLP